MFLLHLLVFGIRKEITNFSEWSSHPRGEGRERGVRTSHQLQRGSFHSDKCGPLGKCGMRRAISKRQTLSASSVTPNSEREGVAVCYRSIAKSCFVIFPISPDNQHFYSKNISLKERNIIVFCDTKM
ncbi:hypothetical protein AVEN_74193-1 [Araneus ventricosus]|uniref:Uncharacterized protein n=1 Tax=Araneus ventricosus TaxID=182803 RepID=A0A4Y2ICT8_ARAVE|nr:hypothetical protein AVEN_74193-1 [Araneus ventricosus]